MIFNRHKPLVINGRQIVDPLASQLAPHMTEERALFVAQLRVQKEFTCRMIAEECGRAWSKPWGARQDIGEALCCLVAAYLGEDWDYLDRP